MITTIIVSLILYVIIIAAIKSIFISKITGLSPKYPIWFYMVTAIYMCIPVLNIISILIFCMFILLNKLLLDEWTILNALSNSKLRVRKNNKLYKVLQKLCKRL